MNQHTAKCVVEGERWQCVLSCPVLQSVFDETLVAAPPPPEPPAPEPLRAAAWALRQWAISMTDAKAATLIHEAADRVEAVLPPAPEPSREKALEASLRRMFIAFNMAMSHGLISSGTENSEIAEEAARLLRPDPKEEE